MMEKPLYKFEDDNYRFGIYQDIDPVNPRREWDNLGTMVCFHNSYDLGDETDLRSQDYNNWNDFYNYIKREEDPLIIMPLYLYDHSGLTISTGDFGDEWDSGMVGFIYVSREKVRKEFDVKRISADLKDKVKTYLEGEVETYDQYLRGSCYGYTIEKRKVCECCSHVEYTEIDSCWGFLASDMDAVKAAVKDYISTELRYMVDRAE